MIGADGKRRLAGVVLLLVAALLCPPVLAALMGRPDGFSVRGTAVLAVLVALPAALGLTLMLPARLLWPVRGIASKRLFFGFVALYLPVALAVALEVAAWMAVGRVEAIRRLVEFHDHGVYEDRTILAPVQTDGSPWRRRGFVMRDGFRAYPPLDAPGMYVNADGFRTREFGRSGGGALRIAVLGGSTVWGSWVTDAHTIPGQLEGLLNTGGGRPVEVYNLGIEGNTFATEIAVLRYVAARQPLDVAVFYHGGNDFFAVPKGGVAVSGKEDGEKKEGLEPVVRVLHQFDLYRLFEAVLLRALRTRGKGDAVGNDDDVEHQVAGYRAHHAEARALCRERGLHCLFFLQPMISSRTRRFGSERAIIETFGVYFPGAPVRYERVVDGIVAMGLENVHDLRDALNGIDGPVFADQVHVSARGNRAIAERIAAVMKLLR